MVEPLNFTPDEIREGQHKLGLPDRFIAAMCGVSTVQWRRYKVSKPDASSARTMNQSTARLFQALLDGYRPKDWPQGF